MMDAPVSNSAAEESRLELAVAAAASERANRPRWLIGLGIALIAVALIFTLVSFNTRRAVLAEVEHQRSFTHQVEQYKGDIDAAQARLNARGTAPNNRLGAAIEESARNNNVTLAGPVGDSPMVAMGSIGMQQHKYTARASNQDPGAVLRWLAGMQTNPETAVLEISRLRLTPGGGTAANTPGWNVDVEFTRWERTR